MPTRVDENGNPISTGTRVDENGNPASTAPAHGPGVGGAKPGGGTPTYQAPDPSTLAPMGRFAGGVDQVLNLGGNRPGQKLQGVHNAFMGAAEAAAPMALPALVAAPGATLGAAALGATGKFLGTSIPRSLGISPEASEVIGDAASIPAAWTGGSVGRLIPRITAGSVMNAADQMPNWSPRSLIRGGRALFAGRSSVPTGPEIAPLHWVEPPPESSGVPWVEPPVYDPSVSPLHHVEGPPEFGLNWVDHGPDVQPFHDVPQPPYEPGLNVSPFHGPTGPAGVASAGPKSPAGDVAPPPASVTPSGVARIGQTPAERIQELGKREVTPGAVPELMRQLRMADQAGASNAAKQDIIRRFERPEYSPRSPRESDIVQPGLAKPGIFGSERGSFSLSPTSPLRDPNFRVSKPTSRVPASFEGQEPGPNSYTYPLNQGQEILNALKAAGFKPHNAENQSGHDFSAYGYRKGGVPLMDLQPTASSRFRPYVEGVISGDIAPPPVKTGE